MLGNVCAKWRNDGIKRVRSKYPICVNGPRRHHKDVHKLVITVFLACISMNFRVSGDVAVRGHGTRSSAYVIKKVKDFYPGVSVFSGVKG